MGYTAFKEMSKINEERFGKVCGPCEPVLFQSGDGNDLKSASLRFIRNRCEGLRFGEVSLKEEIKSGELHGTSLKAQQIPFNLEKDVDRLSFEKALEHFLDSGSADDAYEVYFCYLEMFMGSYGRTKTMIELLSEFEMNGSALLMKHRDHYSHSVYVFALGLAIYETNEKYRRVFREFYGIEKETEANYRYLEFWGLTSLFHDIGYPFELPFEQVMSYFEIDKSDRSAGIPYLSYRCLEQFLALSEPERAHFAALYGQDFASSTALFASDLTKKLGKAYSFEEEYLLQQIDSKPVQPEKHTYFMDHAFFSATRLYRELVRTLGTEKIGTMHVDALSAILLHNSLFKFSISFYKSKPPKKKAPLPMDAHPLAFMLMLCDELQCWDRTAYGRTSRGILYPMSVDFDFGGGNIHAKYHYDLQQEHKIREYEVQRKLFDEGKLEKKPRLKAYSDMTGANDFVSEIKDIVDLSGMEFTAVPDMCEEDRSKKHTFLSSSSFLHLYDFAVMLSARRSLTSLDMDLTPFYEKFDKLSLEYKIQHIERAKYFSRYLHEIDCFYTDRPVDFDLLTAFTQEQIEIIAPLEHERWLKNHYDTGWVYGDEYENAADTDSAQRQMLREQLRHHKLMIDGEITAEKANAHYMTLPPEEQDKDIEPMNWMLQIIRKLDGVKIYKLHA